MAKTMQRVISLLLVAVLVVGAFASCGKSNKEEGAAITATAVKFNKSGQYTTTVSSKKVDLSGITADNVEVRYTDPTSAPEAAGAESTEAVTEETATAADAEAAEGVKNEDVYTLSAKVESVKAADKKSYEITFTDDKAADYLTDNYIVLFKDVEGDNNTADVAVEFPEITLTPDVENVVSDATQAKVTLTIDGSTFEGGISEEDIYLDNAFSDMKIESVSSSDKNLTVQLKGTPVKNAAGAYQWGSVNVKPSGIKDGYADVASKIDIKIASAYIDATTLKYESGKITADLKVYGVVDINTLTKDNIKIDGATIESTEKTDDNTVKLTIAADGVKSVNDFADTVGGKKMMLGDYETTAAVSQASFYPVLDYVEEDGDNLKLTLKLYANCGTFDKKLAADAITFADDFKDAKTESVKVDSDTVATLILSVPANGQTTETLKMNGTVTLAAGSLTNDWGESTSKEASYTRDYSGETLGREVTLNTDTLLEIQKYTRGINTLFGSICYWGSVASQVYNIGKFVLEATGAIKSEHQQLMDELAGINKKLDGIHNELASIRNDLAELKNNDYRIMIQNYQKDFDIFDKKLRDVLSVYEQAAEDITDEYPEYENVTVEKLTNEETAVYNERLMKLISSRENDSSDVDYGDFAADFAEFKLRYESVTSMLKKNTSDNPLWLYDESCALTYNFDSQCYEFRLAQREYAKAQLTKALAVFAIRYNASKNPDNKNFQNMTDDYREAINMIDSLSYVGYPASRINATPEGRNSKISFVSDVLLTRFDSYDAFYKAKSSYEANGYTFTSNNSKGVATINKGINDIDVFDYPYFIYLGYKTTDNYDDAIKDFAILKDVTDNTVEIDGLTYTRAQTNGFNGNFNTGSSRDKLYLYYTKEEKVDNKAVLASGVNFSSTKTEGAGEVNINTSSYKRYLNYERNGLTYCPFSYVFGKRLAIKDTKSMPYYNTFPGAIKNGSSYRNWSDDEIREFTFRIRGNTLAEEFKSAGINIDLPLLFNVTSVKDKQYFYLNSYWLYWTYYGDVIKTNAKSKTNVKLGVVHQDAPGRKGKESQYPNTKELDALTIELL